MLSDIKRVHIMLLSS